MILLLVILPLLAGALLFMVRRPAWNPFVLCATALVHLMITFSFWRNEPDPAFNDWLALDALGLLFLSILSFIFMLAAVYAVGYLKEEKRLHDADVQQPHLFYASLLFFLATMSLVTLSQHLGLLWVAVEATTLASAPLIFHHRTHEALEATWKYLVICSVGIALALLGIFFLGTAIKAEQGSLILSDMLQYGLTLDTYWVRAAFIFLIIGYGTKMGLAPMHTWLPDAHSEAPSPASALLSGVLLNCAFLAILRGYQVLSAAGQAMFAQHILLLFGLLSLGLAAAFLLNQTDYKRMLAYSSVEHMGILALGVGLGPGAAFFVLLHSLNHSLAKSMLFLTSGNILLAFKSKKIRSITGLVRALPWSGFFWICGFLAITGTPPFAPFVSEFNLLGVAISGHRFVVAGLYLAALVMAFLGMGKSVLSMSQGETSVNISAFEEKGFLVAAPLILFLLLLLLGIHIPEVLSSKIMAAARLLGGVQ